MVLFQPKTLRSTIAPTIFIHREIVMGIANHRAGRARKIFNLIRSGTLCLSYGVACYISLVSMSATTKQRFNFIAAFGYNIFLILSAVINTANIVTMIFHNKEHDDCVTELTDIDVAIKAIGVARPYRQLFMQHTCQLFVTISAVFIVCGSFHHVMGDMEEFHNYWKITNIVAFYLLCYQLLSSILGDNAFCIFYRVMTERFEDLNSLLKSMSIQNANDYNTRVGTLIRVEAIFEDKEKLEKLRFIRKIYSRLDDLATRWIKFYEVHIIYTVISAICMLTLNGYGLYNNHLSLAIQSQRSFTESAFRLFVCIVYIVKLFIIVSPVVALATETRKTRGILLMHLQPIAYLRLEVHQFSWDLIQDPIRLSVRELFDLDYTLIHMIFGTVATYLVMLVQTKTV